MGTALPRPTRFRPTVEPLEDRTVPSGNVTAFVKDGVLFVQGDDEANTLWVAGTGKRSAILRPILAGTTINGQAGPADFGDINRGYNVQMGGGDDVLEVSGVNAEKGLRVDGGDGDDTIALTHVSSPHDTNFSGGAGNDSMKVTDSYVRFTVIDGGAGDDNLGLGNSRFGGQTYVNGGDGSNALGVVDVSFRYAPAVTSVATRYSVMVPTAVSDAANVTAGTTVSLPVTANDIANTGGIDPASITVTAGPTQGTATANADGTITYVSTGTSGTDSISYTVRNTAGAVSNVATVNIRIGNFSVSKTGAPTATVTAAGPDPSSLAAIQFTATFDEDVTGFTQAGVSVSNGTASNFTAVDSRTYTFIVTPAGDGAVTAAVNAGAATDSEGTTNAAASRSVTSVRTDAGMTDTVPDTTGPEYTTLPSGVRTFDVTAGTGDAAALSSRITVFYTGFLTDGTVFDKARTTGSPATFNVSGLIQGFQQGVVGQKVGGIRRIFIPAALAYGSAGQGSVPPNSDLIFEVKLLAVTSA